MRAEGWNRLPIVRMTNVSILPGEKPLPLAQLIAEIDDQRTPDSNLSSALRVYVLEWLKSKLALPSPDAN